MKHILFILFCSLLFSQSLIAQCYCEDCPELIINGAPSTATLNISGATNNILGMGGQSLINVGVQFTHDAAQELSLRIVAPNGSFVDLTIGEDLNFGQNNNFDIDFIQCSDAASPDCTNNAVWTSIDEWDEGPYTGSYYPESGCLEDLTGDVNGIWTLEMEDVFVVEDGELYCFDLTFADDSGISCNSAPCDEIVCLAQAGNSITPATVTAPVGDPSLLVDYTVNYNACEFPPTGPEYTYIFIVFESPSETIIDVVEGSTVDMTGYPEGNYIVRGFSILASDLPIILALDFPTSTFFTITQLIFAGSICADFTPLTSFVTIDGCIIDFLGTLESDMITAEVGDPALDPDWDITWVPSAPDFAIWGVYYVVYDQVTGVIIDYLTIDDFTGLVAGDYNVSVLVYNLNDESEIPPANGTTTYSDLENATILEQPCGILFGQNQLFISEPCTIDANGTLEQEDITAPQNDPTLDPDWDITFAGSTPDPAIYGFYFVVVNADTDQLVAYYTSDDFTLLLVGNYYVTVIYYLLSDLPLLLPPNGTNTFADLVALINNGDLCAQYFGNNLLFITPQCMADAGIFNENAITECEGNIDLILDLTPNYSGGGPSVLDYGYTYVVSQNGIIIEINPSEDFTAYAIGEYEICGLSYLLTDESNLPIPNGVLTTSDIISDIMNNVYCADVMTDCLLLTIIEAPLPIFTGPTEVCAGEQVQYEVENFNGNISDYVFFIQDGGFSFLNNNMDGTFDITWTFGPGVICLTETNEGCSEQVCITVEVAPQPTFAIIGPLSVCPGAEEIYTFDPDPVGLEFYDVSVIGGTITNQTTNSVTILWDDSPDGTITVSLLGGECDSELTELEIDIIEEVDFPILSIPVSSCINAGFVIPDINDPDIISWTWSSPNATISIDNGIVSFDWNSIGPTEICLEVISTCDTEQMCYNIEVFLAPDPMIEPELEFCSFTFTLEGIPSFGDSWIWLSPGSSVTYTDQASFITDVTVPGPGTYTFSLTEFAGNCVSTVETTVTITDGLSTDDLVILCDDVGNYIVTFDITSGALPYTVDGIPISGSTYSSANIVSGDSYSFLVEDSNGCTVLVEGSFTCPCISDAGSMLTTPIILCISDGLGGQAFHNGDAVLDTDDLGLYVLHTGDNIVLGTAISINDSGEFFFDAASMVAGQVYYISYIVGNELAGSIDFLDPCLSVAVGQPIVFYDDPVANAGAEDATCELVYNLSANAITLGGDWTVIDQPIGSFADLQIISGETLANVDMPGEYIFELTASENGCSNSDEITIYFLENPFVENLSTTCDGDFYTVSFDIAGGTMPYFVNGQEITNTTFTSAPIMSGENYGYTIIDVNSCSSDLIQGTTVCNCTTDAGTMNQEEITICTVDGEFILGTFNDDATFDGDDTGVFVLHTGSSNILGTILDTNDIPEFIYNSSYGSGVTIYISYVVADEVGGDIDFGDDCLSVSVGQPVNIEPLLQVDAGEYNNQCMFLFDLNADDQGVAGGWDVLDSPIDANIVFSNVVDAQSSFETDLPGQYSIIWSPLDEACILPDTATFTLVSELIIENRMIECADDLLTFVVNLDVSGGVAPYYLDGVETTSNFDLAPTASGTTYSYTLTDSRGCELLIEGTATCECTNEGGTMSLDTLRGCIQDTLIGTYNNDAILDADDVAFFVLHTSSTDALGAVFAISVDPTAIFLPGMIAGNVYYLSQIIGNADGAGLDISDPCLKVAPGQPVIFEAPPEVDAGEDQSICGLTIDMNGATSELTAIWTVIQTPFGAIVNIDENDLNSDLIVTLPGEYILVLESDNGFCTSVDTVSITFIEPIFYEDLVVNCFVDGYTVSFTVQGGSGSYFVDGVALSGNSFESMLITTGEPYSFTISDSEDCAEVVATGTDTCDCENDAGTMDDNLFEVCVDMAINISEFSNNDVVLAENDIRYLVIHTSQTTELGDIIGIVLYDHEFIAFDDFSFVEDVTYYVSTVVAKEGAIVGSIEDPCIAVAEGTPLIWRGNNKVSFSNDIEACVGDIINIDVTASGDFPFEITVTDNLGYNTVLLIDQENISFEYLVTDETILVLDSEAIELCFFFEKSELAITIEELPIAEVRESIMICNDEANGSIVNLDDLLISGFSGGRWIYAGIEIQGTIDFNGFTAGEYKIEYLIESASCSVSEVYEVTVIVAECDCPMFDYISENVTCFGDQDGSITILVTDGLDIGDFMVFLNEEDIGSSEEISDLIAGNYILEISDGGDCIASFDIEILEPDPVQISLGEDMDVEINDPVVIEAITNLIEQEIDGITWESLSGILEENDLLLNTSFQSDDLVSINIIDENGCSDSDEIMVRVTFSDFVIPNVINSNSTTGNDVFRIYNTDGIEKILNMSIYDRWGNLIFDVANVDATSELAIWNGTSKGQAVNPGVYIYKLSLMVRGEEVTYFGDLTVL